MKVAFSFVFASLWHDEDIRVTPNRAKNPRRISISTAGSACMDASRNNPAHVPTSFRLALDKRGQKDNLSESEMTYPRN